MIKVGSSLLQEGKHAIKQARKNRNGFANRPHVRVRNKIYRNMIQRNGYYIRIKLKKRPHYTFDCVLPIKD